MATTQVPFLTVKLIRPSGPVDATRIQDLGDRLLVAFSRPMEDADLQGPKSRFPWTAQSNVSLVEAQGRSKIVHCNKIVRFCNEHQICWLDSDYPSCPQCK
jgi:hypothetical protein